MLADTGFDCEGNVGRDRGGCGDFEEKESWLQPPSAPREIAIVFLSSDVGMMLVLIRVLKERDAKAGISCRLCLHEIPCLLAEPVSTQLFKPGHQSEICHIFKTRTKLEKCYAPSFIAW
jgi:hypothetical protein